jgi:LysR family transcriptional regulator, glycine cleavage system transcriptional activator
VSAHGLDDLERGPLLTITHLPGAWPDAADAWGVALPADIPTLWFDSLETIVRRAEAGSGFALVPRQLIARELTSGALRQLPMLSAVSGPTYWFMTRRGERMQAGIKTFVRWISGRVGPASRQ